MVLVPFLACGFGCAKLISAEPPPKPAPPRSVQLLSETGEKETEHFSERRQDVEVDTRDFDRTPRVVAVGESPLQRLQGSRAFLCGDEECNAGFAVDNFLLIEVLNEGGQVMNRVVVGQVEGASIGAERIDNMGRAGMSFDGREIDLTSRLPESGAFKLRVTALDYGVVGKNSDLFLRLEPPVSASSGDDDLRER